MITKESIEEKYKKDCGIRPSWELDSDESYLINEILKASTPKEDTINPKMKLSKEDLMKHDPLFDEELKEKVKENYTGVSNHHRIVREGFELKDNRIPDYYIGNNGYEARKVIDNFDLSYNVGTATTYLLRCGKKKEEGMTDTEKHIEDLQKAKNHIDFEIERLKE